jgi:hypothetical protein
MFLPLPPPLLAPLLAPLLLLLLLLLLQTAMALRYVASTSTLESHHCMCAFSILRRAESNVFAALGVDDFKEVKKLIVDSILATDMTMHFQLKSDLDDLKTPDAVQTNNHLLAQALVHAADISNPTKPFDICKKWSDLLLEEFFAQGERYALLSGPADAYAAAALAHTFLLCLLLSSIPITTGRSARVCLSRPIWIVPRRTRPAYR